MQQLPASYLDLIATDALKAWEPSLDVFEGLNVQEPLADVSNTVEELQRRVIVPAHDAALTLCC